jgi:hypothetical protein
MDHCVPNAHVPIAPNDTGTGNISHANLHHYLNLHTKVFDALAEN